MRNIVELKLIGLILGLVISNHAIYASEIKVAAAASLTFAMNKLVRGFEQATGHQAKITYDASRNLMHQIVQGAPFEIFLSADEETVKELHALSWTVDKGTVYAVGKLVLFKADDSRLPLDSRLKNLAHWIQGYKLRRLAIDNPEHAPYGVMAKQALQNAGVWIQAKPFLVEGDNAAQTAQFALSSADAALISHGVALIPAFEKRGSYVLVSQDLYSPLNHRMVLIKRRGDAATAFYRYLQGQHARLILASHGFGLPQPGSLTRFLLRNRNVAH